jgi:hypothetical protein
MHRAFDEITWPHLEKTTWEISGEKLPKVEGKYYTIIPDSRLDWKQERYQADEEADRFFKDIYNRPTVRTKGSHKRTGYKGPVVLDVLAGLRELHSQIHFVSHRIPVRNALKALGDPRIRTAVTSVLGDSAYRQLIPWVAHIAKPDKPPQTKTERWLSKHRANIMDYILLYRVSTLLNQPFAVFNAMADSELGTKAFLKGASAFWADRSKWVEYIKANSQTMAHRVELFDKSVADMERQIKLNTSHPLNQFPEWVRESGYGLIGMLDATATLPTWVAAWKVGMDRAGWDEAMAVEYADQVTMRTQGGGSSKDTPLIQQGGVLWKTTFGMLYTFANSMTNVLWAEWQKYRNDRASFSDFAKCYMYMFVLGGLVNYMISKREPPKNGWEVLKAIASYQAGGYPILRDLTSVLEGQDVRGSAVLASIGRQVKNMGLAMAKHDPAGAVVAAIGLAGAYWGFPPDQSIILLEGIMENKRGKRGPGRLLFRSGGK